MNQNEQQPERTAIQEAIEKINIGISEHEAAYEFAKSNGFEGFAKNHLEVTRELISFRDTVLKVLRDTVEKEQMIELIAIGIHSDSYNGNDEDTSMMATKLFDQKYPNHGK